MAPLTRCVALLLLSTPSLSDSAPLASLLKQEAKAEQARSSGFEEWCKSELAAQNGRRDQMKHLHDTVAPMIGDGTQVKVMSQEASKLVGLLDQREAAAVKSASVQSRANITLANLQRDVHTLTNVRSKLEHGASFLQAKKGPLQAVSKLLQTAKTDQRRVLQKILEPSKLKSEAEHIRSQYETTTTELTQLRTRQLAATSSRDLLFSALQDEDMFLADLQDICSVGKDVYTRYEAKVQPGLEGIAQELSETSTLPPSTTLAPTTTQPPPATTQPPTTTPPPAATQPPTTTQPTTTPPATTTPPPTTQPPPPPQTQKHHHKHTTQPPATTTQPPTTTPPPPDDDDDSAPVAPKPKKHHHHKTTTAAPSDDWSGDDDDAAPAPKQKKAAATTTTTPAPTTTQADADDDSAPAPKPVHKHKHAAKTTTADPLAGIDPDDDDMPPPAPKKMAKAKVAVDSADNDDDAAPVKKQAAKAADDQKGVTKKQDFLVDMYASAAGRMPGQYNAWTPGSKDDSDLQGTAKAGAASAVDSFKKALDDDDDDDAPPPPVHKHATAAPSSDDDSAAPPSGDPDAGWKAQMKTKKVKKHKFKDDSENVLSIIQTPHTYSAWTPNHNDKTLKASASNELAAAEAAFDSDDFLQLRSQTHRAEDASPLHSTVGGLIQAAVEEGQEEDDDEVHEDEPAMFLERSSTTVETSTLDATSLLLEQYGTALGSQPLLQLARSRLSVTKLKNLWHKVQTVDTHSLHDARSKKEAVWCRDFQRTAEAQAQKTRVAQRQASEELLQVQSQHTVLQQEVAAADQILRMLDAGTQQMRELQDRVQHQFDSTDRVLAKADEQASSASKAVIKNIGQLQGDVETSNAEFVDIVGTVLARRTTAEEARKKSVTEIHAQMAMLEQQQATLHKQSAERDASKAEGAGLRSHYEEMCSWVLADEDDRESREACEKDAIHAALVVLQTR